MSSMPAGDTNPGRGKTSKDTKEKRVTRGHNIVVDGWAGASDPGPHPNSHLTHKHSHKVSKMLVFSTFGLDHYEWTDQWTNGRTDRRMEGQTKPFIELRVRN